MARLGERYYIMRDGQKVFAKTVTEIHKLAMKLANETDRNVPVFMEAIGIPAKRVGKTINARRNPASRGDPHGFWVVTGTKNGKRP
jgi:hypothetical protein